MWTLRQCIDNALAFVDAVPAWRRYHDLAGCPLQGPAYLPDTDIRHDLGVDPTDLAASLERAGFLVGQVRGGDGVCVGLVWGHTVMAREQAELAILDLIEERTGKLITPEYSRA